MTNLWLRDNLFHRHDTQQAFLSQWTMKPGSSPKDLHLPAIYE